nr:unnamed protein product [Haemonchus contortus]
MSVIADFGRFLFADRGTPRTYRCALISRVNAKTTLIRLSLDGPPCIRVKDYRPTRTVVSRSRGEQQRRIDGRGAARRVPSVRVCVVCVL